MKNTFTLLGIIAIAAIVGLSFASCIEAGDAGGTVTNEKAVYTSVDAEGNVYELTITPQSNRTAYEPKAGDTYTLTIFYKDGTTKTSVGTVTYEVKSGSTVTATLAVSDISYTVTLITITDDVRVFTEIKGTIPITDGNNDDPTTIEIELTLTPQVDNESKAVIGVILNKTALALDLGGSETLVATVLPTNAKNKNVTWSSSKTEVAMVSETGEVFALAKGEAVVTVTTEDGNKEAICNVSVNEVLIEDQTPVAADYTITGLGTVSADGNPKAVTIQQKAGKSPGIITVYYNGSVIAPSETGTYAITFNVAAANGWNSASGLSAGTLVITSGEVPNQTPVAEDYNISGTGTFSADGTPKSVTIQPKSGKSPGTVTVLYNESTTAPSAAGTYAIIFNVSAANGWNPATGLSAGTLVITSEAVPNQTPVAEDYNISGIGTISADGTPKSVTIQPKTGKSPGVITVLYNGSATAPSATGTYVITFNVAAANGWNSAAGLVGGTLIISITSVPVTGVTLNKNTLDLTVGASETLIATVLPVNATNNAVDWDSNNKTVATVSVNGTVTAIADGKATITVTTKDGNKTANCAVTVTESVVDDAFTSIAAFQAWLNSQPDNTIASAYEAKLKVNDLIGIGSVLLDVPNKYVKLDLTNSTVTSIEDSAFWGCENLLSITIPNSVTSCYFIFCTNLTAINVGSGNNTFSSDNGVLFNKNKTTLIRYPEGKAETSFSIPNSVLSIGDNAFSQCRNLANITIPNSVTSIGGISFSKSGLTSITIPDNVTSIGQSAFWGCENLLSATIGNGVTSLGQSAFYNCSSLTSITIGNNVKSIEMNTFLDCTSLTSIIIPNSVTSIGWNAFRNCTGLAIVTIESGSIGSQAFQNCNSIVTLNLGNGVTSIGFLAFDSCTSLTSVIIPKSITYIEEFAFEGCTSIASVIIENGATVIGGFVDCTSITSVNIPNSVTSIGERAFAGCTSLANVIIGSGVTSIGEYAFSGCTSLATSVTIPDSVTSIGRAAFAGCNILTAINVGLGNNAYSSENGVLYNKNKTAIISYPAGKTSTAFILPDGVTSIGDGAFSNCASLTSITIPASVTSIGNSAFSGCTSLASITIPSIVTSIGWNAFQDCASLTSVTIPDSVTSIGGEAFKGCTSLISVTFLGTIPSSGFSNVSGSAAFYGDLRYKFYATNASNGTPGTYTRVSGSSTIWTLQQ